MIRNLVANLWAERKSLGEALQTQVLVPMLGESLVLLVQADGVLFSDLNQLARNLIKSSQVA